jgi:hypothetical protein
LPTVFNKFQKFIIVHLLFILLNNCLAYRQISILPALHTKVKAKKHST